MKKEEQLARELFENLIVKINPYEPFTWASGIKSPIYTNFRMTMNSPVIRAMILELLADKIIEKMEKGLDFDAFIGTSTAGIWIAKLLSERFEKPLLILKDGKAIQETCWPYDSKNNVLELLSMNSDINLIVSGCPFGISSAISLAYQKGWSMGYVRSKPKKHGDIVSIEGSPTKGSNAFVVDLYEDNSQLEQIKEVLAQAKINFKGKWSAQIEPKPFDLNGKKVFFIEDLISTGGSLFKEAEVAIALGAIIEGAGSIFTYDFPGSDQNARGLGLPFMVHALTIHDLMRVGVNDGFIKMENEKLLAKFFEDPKNWYEIHHPDGQLNGC